MAVGGESARGAGVRIEDSVGCSAVGITADGSIDAVQVIGGEGNSAIDITKRGAGYAVYARGTCDLQVKNVRHLDEPGEDFFLFKAMEEDIHNKNKEGFFSKCQRFGRLLPPERLAALMQLAEKVFRSL